MYYKSHSTQKIHSCLTEKSKFSLLSKIKSTTFSDKFHIFWIFFFQAKDCFQMTSKLVLNFF